MSQEAEQQEKDIAKTLRLRSSPPPIARLSRPALIICGAVLASGLAGALGWSLIERQRAAPDQPFTPAPPPPETIANLPKDYGAPSSVPVLGPPLPGDLGRPILRAQAGLATPIKAEVDQSPPAPVEAEPLRRVRVQEASSSGSSGLFVGVIAHRAAMPTVAAASAVPVAPVADSRMVSAERLQPPASPYLLQAGAIIPAVLITGLRSDVPGQAVAQVSQDVFDSLGGGHLLVPQGARLIGEYDAQLASGQSRLGVVWTRLILPSGRSIVLDKLPGADLQGMAGLQDGVDRHTGDILAAAGLSTLLAIGAESGASDENDLARAVRRGAAQAVSDVGQQAVGRSLSRAPTLTIRPGAPLRVLLTRDLVLEPYGEER